MMDMLKTENLYFSYPAKEGERECSCFKEHQPYD